MSKGLVVGETTNDADYWRNRCSAAEQQLAGLQSEIVKVQELLALERKHHSEFVLIGKKPVPVSVVRWMNKYEMPWEVFWCKEHHMWFEVLDCFFPNFGDDCLCPKCMK